MLATPPRNDIFYTTSYRPFYFGCSSLCSVYVQEVDALMVIECSNIIKTDATGQKNMLRYSDKAFTPSLSLPHMKYEEYNNKFAPVLLT